MYDSDSIGATYDIQTEAAEQALARLEQLLGTTLTRAEALDGALRASSATLASYHSAVGTAAEATDGFTASLQRATAAQEAGAASSGARSAAMLGEVGVGLPALWTSPGGSPWTDAGALGTTIRPVLRGDLTDSQWIVLTPSATNAATATSGGFPTLTTQVEVLPSSPTGQVNTFSSVNAYGGTTYAHNAFLPGTVQLHYAARVQASHWAYGLQHAMSDADVVRSQVDPRDFDWSTVPAVVDATLSSSGTSARDWFFDGSQTWNDVISETLMLEACVWSLRNSRLALVPIGPPVQGSTPAATLTTASLVGTLRPKFSRAVDEMITGERIKAPGLDLLVNNSQAAGRYGKGQIPEVTLDGNVLARTAASDPVTFARDVLHRIASWGKPLALVSIPLPPATALGLAIGDYVDVSEWLLPNLTGSRGLGSPTALALLAASSQRIQILGRSPDLTGSPPVVWVEGILWGAFASGYAPCCRVASLASNVLTIAGPGYANGSDYAGSDGGGGYPGTANDGGTSYFKVGDAVELLQRGVASYVAFPSTITAVNAAARTITLAATPPGSWSTWAAAADTPVDLRYDHYAACQASQKPFAFVGSNTNPFAIDATADKDKRFAA